jgi:hypothetical protein
MWTYRNWFTVSTEEGLVGWQLPEGQEGPRLCSQCVRCSKHCNSLIIDIHVACKLVQISNN